MFSALGFENERKPLRLKFSRIRIPPGSYKASFRTEFSDFSFSVIYFIKITT